MRVSVADAGLGPGSVRLPAPRFPAGHAGVEIVDGWTVAAVIIIAPLAVNSLARTEKPRPVYHPLPRSGRMFQAVVAYAGPEAEPLSIAAANDAGAVSLSGGALVRVWVNHVPHRAAIDELVVTARHDLAARCDNDGPPRPAFLRASTDQGLPLLIDLGHTPDPAAGSYRAPPA